MRQISETLAKELATWEHWALTATRETDGWQEYAPNFMTLVAFAQQLLLQQDLTPEEIGQLEAVFCLSHETEFLADHLKANYDLVPKETIRELLATAHRDVRWQVYDSLIRADEFSLDLLCAGLDDPDVYVRRRAFFRLIEFGDPPAAALHKARLDSDHVIRREARKRVRES